MPAGDLTLNLLVTWPNHGSAFRQPGEPWASDIDAQTSVARDLALILVQYWAIPALPWDQLLPTLYQGLAIPYNARARNVRARPRARARGMNLH